MRLFYRLRIVVLVVLVAGMILACSSGSGSGECFWCEGTGRRDCSFCDDGIDDCALCSNGRTASGNTCSYCNGDGEKTCTFCNGRGYDTCNQCNGTGRD